jgi:hypothetical protein
MLVKFEEEDKVYGNPIPIVDIDELSTIAGKLEGEVLNERYVPTEDQMNKLEDELRKLNEQKFGNLVEQPQEEQSEIKRLSYTKR